jgi:hypothetical protein
MLKLQECNIEFWKEKSLLSLFIFQPLFPVILYSSFGQVSHTKLVTEIGLRPWTNYQALFPYFGILQKFIDCSYMVSSSTRFGTCMFCRARDQPWGCNCKCTSEPGRFGDSKFSRFQTKESQLGCCNNSTLYWDHTTFLLVKPEPKPHVCFNYFYIGSDYLSSYLILLL